MVTIALRIYNNMYTLLSVEIMTINSYCLLTLGSAHAQDIYKFTRMAIDTNVSMTRYEVPRGRLNELYTIVHFVYFM